MKEEPKKLTPEVADEILDEFVDVTTTHLINGGSQRGKPILTIVPSGRGVLNAEATVKWDSLVQQYSLDPEQCCSTFKVAKLSRRVACYPSVDGIAGCMPVRRQAAGAVVHLGGVFEEYAELRVPGERECIVRFEPDKKGRDCMMIYLGNPAVKSTRRRSSNSNNSSDSNAGQQEAQAQPKKASAN